MNSFEETIKIIKWARKHGALLIKVNGVELTFPPDIDMRPHYTPHVSAPASTLAADKEIIRAHDKKAEEFIRNPSALDDPDYFIREQDAWATHTRPPQIG